jgi:hypothetical protein
MRDPRQWPAPWLFGLLILPLGIYVGFIWTALPLLLSQAGLTIEQIARINAILQVPPILLFLWTPVVDVNSAAALGWFSAPWQPLFCSGLRVNSARRTSDY